MTRSSSRAPAELARRLDALAHATDAAARLASDPLGLVRAHRDRDDREVVALIAALLAFGNVVAIRRSISRVLAALGPRPARAIASRSEAELARDLDGFVHRVYRGDDVARVLAQAAAIRREHGSIGEWLARSLRECDAEIADPDAALVEALARLADRLRGRAPVRRGLAHLVPDPRAGSACKRLLLFLRWCARPDDGVDLGLFPIDAARLVVPLDTHVHRIAQNLGLTRRRDASMRTALEITRALRVLDGADPVRYDFALCHLGISRACPSRRDPALCEGCVVRDVCRHWARDRRDRRPVDAGARRE